MKFVFFSFKHRHRYKDLNNFLNSRIYGKYFILNLSGPFMHFIAKLLIFLKIGKAISCDGRPVITDKSRGINFWVRGTILNIPKSLRNLNNNFVTIYHSVLLNDKIFQIYPINIKKSQIQNKLKIIYMSTINIETNSEEKRIWEKYKFQILEDFSLIDSRKFWEKVVSNGNHNNEDKKLALYRKLKLLLRFDIIKKLKERFNKELNLFGNDWNYYAFNPLPSNYNIKKNKKIYEGNICLDLGCIEGSSSLYSRSNQIIESGGLIVQSFQCDGKKIWGDLHDKILFKNLPNLITLLEKLLNDKNYCSILLQEIYKNFIDSNKSIEKSLDKVFNTPN
jgi:hypothetical protein